MKNIMSYLLVVFSLLGVQTVHAGDTCETAGEVKLSELWYVGVKLTTLLPNSNCSVVRTKNRSKMMADYEASELCNPGAKLASDRKFVALNPGNPQYQVDGSKKYGSPKNNTIGYYFCVTMDKHDMCNKRTTALSTLMDIDWKYSSNNHAQGVSYENDGDCWCKVKGGTSRSMVCPNSPEQLQALQNGTNCTISGTEPGTGESKGQCICKINSKPPEGNPAACPSAPPAVATVNDADFDECFASVKASNEACSETGQKAIDTCNQNAPENNKSITEAQRILSLGTDVLIGSKAGTGALGSCTAIGAAGAGAYGVLSLLKEKCNSELNACKRGCEAVKAFTEQDPEARLNACKEKLGSKWTTPAHDARFTELVDAYKGAGDSSEKFCTANAQNANTDLDETLNRLLSSIQQADMCRCQLSAGTAAGTDCATVPSVATCAQNPTQTGCSLTSVGCGPNSTSTNCANTAVTTNMGGSGVAAPSGFAAVGGFSSVGGNTSKLKVGDSDLSGFYQEATPFGSGTTTADPGSPFGNVAGGGGGGGGQANFSNGGAGQAGGGKEGEGSDKGLSGLFQSAKGAVMSMFGGPNNGANGVKKDGSKGSKNDVNGFRPKVPPVRGMANTNEFGGKNRDIWKTMNQRYGDQYHTFITVENPSK